MLLTVVKCNPVASVKPNPEECFAFRLSSLPPYSQVYTVKSRFLKPPGETPIGSRNQRWHQITINWEETLVYDLRNVPGTFAQIIEVHIISKKVECAKHADCMAKFKLCW